MRAAQLGAALTIWRARKNRTVGDRAYVAYLLIMVAAIAIAPVIRALWLGVTSAAGVAFLAADQAPEVVSFLAALLWSGALLLGRSRGPALLPPFLLHVVATSGMKRSVVLGSPVVRAAACTALASAGMAGFVSAVLLAQGHAGVPGVLGFIVAASAAGVIATLLALVGQAVPKTATLLGIGILAVASLGGVLSAPTVFLPWGWVGAAYPVGVSGMTSAFLPLIGVTALALALVAISPRILNALSLHQLSSQAAKWDAAVTFSSTLDFSLTAAVYQGSPRLGRRLRAARPYRQLPVTFFVRDAVGLLRTPGRLIVALSTTIAAGGLLSPAPFFAAPTVPLTAGAALLLYLSTSVLGQGLRHAAHVAGDYPLYGVSDRALVAYHALFPFLTTGLLVTATVVVSTTATAALLGTPLVGALMLVVLVLMTRLNGALKGPLPPRLLAPIDTPAGDLSTVLQLAWAFGEPLVAILAGIVVAVTPLSPIPALVMAVCVSAVSALRWRNRR